MSNNLNFRVIFQYRPVETCRSLAVYKNLIDLGDINQTKYTKVEKKVHFPTSYPHNMRNVRGQLGIRRHWHAYFFRAIEELPHTSTKRSIQSPDILWVQTSIQHDARWQTCVTIHFRIRSTT